MTTSQWRLVEEIFLAALGKEAEERELYVEEACVGNDELRREVESLLVHESGGAAVLKSAVNRAARQLTPVPDKYVGSRIGPYQVVRQLSQGGMGVVYLAVRSDDHYFQTVAIKLVRFGMASEEVIARFRYERQILANLTHPNIAAILDGGSTGDGLPYIVMEFVEGQPITEFSKDRELPLRDRIALFCTVCLAVHYAHQKLVIHRDIKPGNILVTPYGIPKLLDFGIAKLLLPEPAPSDSPTTGGSIRMMTPDYASPEQVVGEALTTGSDVYSLGVVLFELLTGSRPYSTADLPPRELERVVCEQSASRPSETPGLSRRLRKQLKGDLDNIVLMAMRKEPSRRYQSAEQFSEDLNRYLRSRPVLARGDTIGYRLAKFRERHKTAILLGAFSILIVFAAILFSMRQFALADGRVEEVREVASSVISDLSGQLQQVPTSTEVRVALIQNALLSLDKLTVGANRDGRVLLAVARGYERIGDLQGSPFSPNLGNTSLAATSYEKALATAEHAAAYLRDDDSTETLIDVRQRLGKLQTYLSDGENARRNLTAALDLARAFSDRKADDQRRKGVLAWAYASLGDLEIARLSADGALKDYQAAIEALGPNAVNTADVQRSRGRFYNRVGHALMQAGYQQAAIESYYQAAAISEDLARRFPAQVSYRRDLFVVYMDEIETLAGREMLNLGQVREAVSVVRKALDITEDLAARDLKNAQAQSDLALIYQAMGDALRLSAPDEAAGWYRKSLAITIKLGAAKPVAANILEWQASREQGLASTLHSRRDVVEKRRLLNEANTIRQNLASSYPDEPRERNPLMRSYCEIGDAELISGSGEQATAPIEKAIDLAAKLGSQSRNAIVQRDLGLCYETFGNWQFRRSANPAIPRVERKAAAFSAAVWYQRSLEVWKQWHAEGKSTPASRGEEDRVSRLIGSLRTSTAANH